MKTIIFTTKESEDCYQTIKDNWFRDSRIVKVRIQKVFIDTKIQSEYNNVRVIESCDYRLCLTQCMDPRLPQEVKADFVLALVCEIAKVFNSSKEDLYVMFHSGDLFSLGDSRRRTGILPLSDISCSPELLSSFKEYAIDGHLYQFRHDVNAVADFLLECEGNAEVLGNKMIKLFDNETL